MQELPKDLGEASEEAESVFTPPGVAYKLTDADVAWYLSERGITQQELIVELLLRDDTVETLTAPRACVLCRRWHGAFDGAYNCIGPINCGRLYKVQSTDRLRAVNWFNETARMFREYFGLFRLLGEPWKDGILGYDMVTVIELVLRSKTYSPYLDAVVALRHGLGDETTTYEYRADRTLDPDPTFAGRRCFICGAEITTGGALSAHVKGHDNYVRRAITHEAQRPRKSRAVLRLRVDGGAKAATLPRKSGRVPSGDDQP